MERSYLSVFSPNAGKYGKSADQNNSEFGVVICHNLCFGSTKQLNYNILFIAELSPKTFLIMESLIMLAVGALGLFVLRFLSLIGSSECSWLLLILIAVECCDDVFDL